jgi:hypothetical protein
MDREIFLNNTNRMTNFKNSAGLMLIAVALVMGCGKKTKPLGDSQTDPKSGTTVQPVAVESLTADQQKIKSLSDSETLIQSLSTQLKTLARSFTDRSTDVSAIVDQPIEYVGLENVNLTERISDLESSEPSVAVTLVIPVSGQTRDSIPFASLWQPILADYQFNDAQLGVLKGTFPGENEFEMETKFEGRFIGPEKRICGVKGHQTLGWKKSESGEWKLASWKQEDLTLVISRQTIFEDVTASAFPDESTRKKIASSSHADLILRHSREKTASLLDARPEFKSFNDWESAYQYPAVSVVDIDRDGFDDLFLTDRWQSAQLLRNKGDGTFEDVTEASGLSIPELANCAYFADFDNDGDSDVFVGRTLGPSKYFVNEGGVFKEDEDTIKVLKDSRFVVSGSIADVNRDGLLDLYLSTYAYGSGDFSQWIDQTTRLEDQLKTRLRFEKSHAYVDRVGPPNILLMNRGGKFEWVKIGDELKQYRDSYQSAWTDFDHDGDLDLYICNDFSPDVFLRNDTEQGSFEPKFTDVTHEIAETGAMGFGMGASWGDFDSDGDLDLYVSNMYSKAGNRIVAQLDGVDERIKVSARGNFLYENKDGKFQQVAGTGENDQHASSVGWSFGGQFFDADNDGQLDLYVPSGFYSPPAEVRGDVDL